MAYALPPLRRFLDYYSSTLNPKLCNVLLLHSHNTQASTLYCRKVLLGSLDQNYLVIYHLYLCVPSTWQCVWHMVGTSYLFHWNQATYILK